MPRTLRPTVWILCAALVLAANPAGASHFRFGHIHWELTGGLNEVVFKVDNSFRRGGYTGTASDGSLAVGDTFLETIGGTSLAFGDGASTSTLLYEVDAINTVEDWVVAHAIDPSTGTHWRHAYLTAGVYTAKIDSCCRTGEEINNPNLGYEVSTVVDLTIPNESPVSGITPIVACPSGPCLFQVPAVDFDLDQLSFRLSAPFEAGDAGFSQPGQDTDSPLSISPAGLVSWDSSEQPIGLYSTSITLTENRGGGEVGKVMLDFLINTDRFLGVAPEFDVPPTPENGEVIDLPGGVEFTTTLQCSDGDAGDNVTIGHLGLPVGAKLTPPNPTGNPAVGTLTWTPILSEVAVVSLTCEDTSGNSALPHSFALNVAGLEIPGGGPGDDDLFCDGMTIPQLIASGLYNVIDHRLLGPSTITGTPGRDLILSSGFGDRLLGGDGDDCIIAGVGDDFASGAEGDDQIFGWNGEDLLDGGPGNDQLFGWDKNDTLLGGPGNDLLDGWDDEDVLKGGSGNDTLIGGKDIDVLEGGAGKDDLSGGFNDDILDGGAGADTIDGGPDDDVCIQDPLDPAPIGCVTFLPQSTAPGIVLRAGDQSLDEGDTLDVLVAATDPEVEPLFWTGRFLPPFVSLIDHGDRTATLRIQPVAGDAGLYPGVVLRVQDEGLALEFSQSDYDVITIDVTGGNQAPMITQPLGDQTLDEGDTVSTTIVAVDPDGDQLSYSVIGLPPFATFVDHFDGSATLTLTPQEGDAGSYPGIFFRVVDDGVPVLEDTEIITVDVLGSNLPPEIVNPPGNLTLVEGETLTLDLVAEDPNPDDVLTWSGFDLPAFATLTDNLDRTATLELRPGPGDAGLYQGVVLIVTDDAVPPLEDIAIFSVTVDPAVTPQLTVTGTCPGAVTFTVTGTPGARAGVVASLAEGTTVVPGGACPGVVIGLQNPIVLGATILDGTGSGALLRNVPAPACGAFAQALDTTTCLVSGVEVLP